MATENNLSESLVSKTLSEWQQHLTLHFSALAQSRKSNHLTVFAIEHGVSTQQLALIFEQLRKEFSNSGFNKSHWLVWLIYATELGYTYDGDEYWTSFESYTPNWTATGHLREQVRWVFSEFNKKFAGAKPEGVWANHFSIISWPITHAILSRDLLGLFAKLLYSTRHKFSKENITDPKSIGSMLAARSYYIHSTRFQNFLEQEELVGRIALALISDKQGGDELETILPTTLSRIVHDLEKKSGAKEWITETKKEVKTKILGTASFTSLNRPQEKTSTTRQPKRSIPRPRLMLYRTGHNQWDVIIEIPKIGLDDISYSGFIRKTRISIVGTQGTWIPGDELFYGIKRKLFRWPHNNTIVKFEKNNVFVQNIFDTECIISSSQPWIFRVGKDGIAYEIVGKILQPGSEYILFYVTENRNVNSSTSPCEISCEGINARYLNVPVNLSLEKELELQNLGFVVQKNISIWPIGMPARFWDGEGMSQWLTTENPTFVIVNNHPVHSYELSVDDQILKIAAKEIGEPTFILLPRLQVGKHILTITPITKDLSRSELQGVIIIEVREPITWVPGTMLHNGLSVIIDPTEDNIDAFLSLKAELRIFGPSNRSVSIQFDFFAANELLGRIGPKNFSLPIDANEIKKLCIEAIREESLQSARRMNIIVSGDDLGQRVLHLQRDIYPLRWIYRLLNKKAYLRLIDESDSFDALQVSYYKFDLPMQQEILAAKEWIHDKESANSNGLFIAKKGKHEQSIIVSHLKANNSFEALQISPQLKIPKDRLTSIIELGDFGRKWYFARGVNLMAQLHQQKILETFVGKMFNLFCGNDWNEIELGFMSEPNLLLALNQYAGRIGNRSMADIIRFRLQTKDAISISPDEEKKWFLGVAERCGICKKRSLSYFAIKVASNPLQIDEYFKDDFKKSVDEILRYSVLMRSARLYALGISRLKNPEKADAFMLPAGWRWN